jgi:hypothetical protein
LQQHVVSAGTVVVVVAVVSVLSVVVVMVVVLVDAGSMRFRHTHAPLGAHAGFRPCGHARSGPHSASSPQLVQTQSPAASQRPGCALARPRRQRAAQSSSVAHRPKARRCRVQTPATHVGLTFPGAMQSAEPAQ